MGFFFSVEGCFKIQVKSAWTCNLVYIPDTEFVWTSAIWTILSIDSYCLNQQVTKEDKITVLWCVEKATILSVLLPADTMNGTKTREQWNDKYVLTAWNPQAKIIIQMSVEL